MTRSDNNCNSKAAVTWDTRFRNWNKSRTRTEVVMENLKFRMRRMTSSQDERMQAAH
jgi:hypothetical protein